MHVILKNIRVHANGGPVVYSIETSYGWNGKTCVDVIRLQYTPGKRDITLAVRARHQGVAFVLERVIEVLQDHDLTSPEIKHPCRWIVEHLNLQLGMTFDEEMLASLPEN